MVIWITGLSAAGKTTTASLLYSRMKDENPATVLLDGDQVRDAFGGDLGHSEADRWLQVRRLQSVARLLDRQGINVIVAVLYSHPDFLSWNREHFSRYLEVYLEADLSLLRKRDPKGLYRAADSGKMPDVVGIDIPWHAPTDPHVHIRMAEAPSTEAIVERILQTRRERDAQA